MSRGVVPNGSLHICETGHFLLRRKVPNDLRDHYTSGKVSFSLRTRKTAVAKARATKASQQLDEHWHFLRTQNMDLPGKHMLRMGGYRPAGTATGSKQTLQDEPGITLSEAVAVYLRLKGANRPATFHRAAERSCGYVIDSCGDKDITAYTRADANAFRDALIDRKLSGNSITRVFGTVRSIINFAAAETGITLTNPFAGVHYDRKAGVEDRETLAITDIRMSQGKCRAADDEARWLVALVSDTGLRLAEAAGLHLDDIVLGASVPHVVIREHPWRRLKTSTSTRLVPLAGEALWAAERVLATRMDNQFAFPRYNKGETTNANSASAALNKWMKPHVPERCTMHSFRHSMRDRLRAVECPSDIVDQIGGWQTEGVGHGYGKGYPLEVLAKSMSATA